MGRRISRNRKPRRGGASRAALAGYRHHGRQLERVDQLSQGPGSAGGVSNPPIIQAASASRQVTPRHPDQRTAHSHLAIDRRAPEPGLPFPASPGYNLVLQPTGTATAAEVKRQLFKAVYTGTYLISPGSFSSQSMQVFLRGAGQPRRCCTATSRCAWLWLPIPPFKQRRRRDL